MSFWTAQNQAHAMSRLIAGGLSLYGAAGLVSRWANVESIAAGPAAINPSSKAFGIAQWLGARKTGIYPNTDFDAQLAYALSELFGSESRAGNVLRGAQDADTAATGASMYERAEGYNAASGRDNFTARTAAGIPGVLANYQGASASAEASDQQSAISTQSIVTGGGTALAVVAGLAFLYWYLSD